MLNANFRKVCLGNLLLFVAQYMIVPILPVVMAGLLDLSIATTGCMYLAMTLGMLLIGSFNNYLMDIYSRRSLCIFTFVIVLIATAGYLFVQRPLELWLLSFFQGVAFGVGNSSIITLGVDVNISDHRSRGNVIFGWFTRLGMILGVAAGSAIYLNYNFEILIMASVVTGIAGIGCVAFMRIPFRAPIGAGKCSLDRFFLPHAFPFVINMILIAFVSGILFPLLHFKMRETFHLDEWTVPYFVIAGVAFLFSAFVVRMIRRSPLFTQALVGLGTLAGSICSLLLIDSVAGQLISAVLFGAGLCIITPAFLLFFINLSSHCQRSTTNITHLLSWKIGISLGIATSCALTADGSSVVAFRMALVASLASIFLFVMFSYPYYQKKKVR